MALLSLLVLIIACANETAATRYAAGDDIVVDAERRLYLAYIVEEDDIMVKKACNCMPRRHCVNTDSVHLTE